MANKLWKTKSTKLIHKNPWFKLYEDSVVKPNGIASKYYEVRTNGNAVFVIALDSKKRILMIKQQRYLVKEDAWELPAGNADGSNDLKGAKRELQEESGFKAKIWKRLGSFYTMKGLLSERCVVFEATSLTQTGINEQEEEGIVAMQFFTQAQLKRMIAKGIICDGQTIASLYLFFLNNK